MNVAPPTAPGNDPGSNIYDSNVRTCHCAAGSRLVNSWKAIEQEHSVPLWLQSKGRAITGDRTVLK